MDVNSLQAQVQRKREAAFGAATARREGDPARDRFMCRVEAYEEVIDLLDQLDDPAFVPLDGQAAFSAVTLLGDAVATGHRLGAETEDDAVSGAYRQAADWLAEVRKTLEGRMV